MRTVLTLVAALIVVAPFVVLTLRTTRWDPVGHLRRHTSGLDRVVAPNGRSAVDLPRVLVDLAAARAHADH
ncbi:hypothetical protein [Cellulomonas sp. URHD0024]|uniref:hypothetical protein n=1 Tax=Cellulomonas sp. URHD0024 TaxID=1302620 RepID=UPI0004199284|nr:hypothetical protein [Cellulomonas sp. URHD0024]